MADIVAAEEAAQETDIVAAEEAVELAAVVGDLVEAAKRQRERLDELYKRSRPPLAGDGRTHRWDPAPETERAATDAERAWQREEGAWQRDFADRATEMRDAGEDGPFKVGMAAIEQSNALKKRTRAPRYSDRAVSHLIQRVAVIAFNARASEHRVSLLGRQFGRHEVDFAWLLFAIKFAGEVLPRVTPKIAEALDEARMVAKRRAVDRARDAAELAQKAASDAARDQVADVALDAAVLVRKDETPATIERPKPIGMLTEDERDAVDGTLWKILRGNRGLTLDALLKALKADPLVGSWCRDWKQKAFNAALQGRPGRKRPGEKRVVKYPSKFPRAKPRWDELHGV